MTPSAASPVHFSQTLEQADALCAAGQPGQALALARQLWANGLAEYAQRSGDADSLGWWCCQLVTQILNDQGRHAEALPWAPRRIEFPDRQPDDDYIIIGETYLHLRQEQQALAFFHKAYQQGKARAFNGHPAAWQFYKNQRPAGRK